jgi:DNA-binding NtrC family response regulator
MTRIVSPDLPLLVVDDEAHALQSAERMLVSAGISNILQCQDPRKVTDILSNREISVVLLDLSMPYISGEELLPNIISAYPEVPVIIVTGSNEVETAVRCMKAGAFDYMVKPVERSRLLSGVQRAIELRELRRENELMRERLLSDIVRSPEAFSAIVTNNPAMYALFRYCESIAKSLWPVLLTGETGVGKELLAGAIHALSGRSGPFVAVNAAGLDDNVFSDALFGHVRGAYTGADESRKGLIERAAAGTLFLDEIGDLTHTSQVKLLRVLQEREYYPLGSDVAKRTDARIVFATNRDLEALQASGHFRKDLYHRLKTHPIHVPPLRKRLDDIPILVNHFLEKAAAALNKKKPSPPKELYALLATYSFPGNVRELESMVFDAVANHESRMLSMAVFEARISQGPQTGLTPATQTGEASPYAFFDRLPTLKESTLLLIAEAMRRAEGNQTIAARLLGISRTGLNKRLSQSTD